MKVVMDHAHHSCAHNALKFCAHCNTVWCQACKVEWRQNHYPYGWTYQTYPSIGSFGTATGAGSGGLGGYNVSTSLAQNIATACAHGGD